MARSRRNNGRHPRWSRAQRYEACDLLDVATTAGRVVAGSTSEAALGAVVDAALGAGFEGAELCVFDPVAQTYEVLHPRGLPPTYPSELPAGAGIAGLAYRKQSTVIVGDYANWPSGVPAVQQLGYRSVIATPVRTAGEIVAVLVAGVKRARILTAEEVQCIELLAAHAGTWFGSRRSSRTPDASIEQIQREKRLRDAVHDGELALVYQPLVAVATGRITGMEALVRWDDPSRGRLPPAAFIPFAEASGLIPAIDRWVTEHACSEFASWETAGIWICVNVSPTRFADPLLLDELTGVLDRHHLPPDALVLEVTERDLLRGDRAMVSTMRRIRDRGIRLAVDDFGLGYSSLDYLRRFPFSILKIDRSFVAGIDRDGADRAIVRSVVELARALGIDVVAEGVETTSQLAYLRDVGCAVAQGFGLYQPLDGVTVPSLLADPAAFR